jgi:hypothetical protein
MAQLERTRAQGFLSKTRWREFQPGEIDLASILDCTPKATAPERDPDAIKLCSGCFYPRRVALAALLHFAQQRFKLFLFLAVSRPIALS